MTLLWDSLRMVKNEVEREILALILITIIVVSLLGTWTILRVIDKQQKAKTVDKWYDSGATISLVILPPERPQEIQQSGGT